MVRLRCRPASHGGNDDDQTKDGLLGSGLTWLTSCEFCSMMTRLTVFPYPDIVLVCVLRQA